MGHFTMENGLKEEEAKGLLDFGDGTSFSGDFENGRAIGGQYDWGDGTVTNSYQDEDGNWLDYEE